MIDLDRSASIILGYRPSWQAHAACVGMTDVFLDKTASLAAKRICHACPVERKCLQYAIDHNELCDVWGGMSPHERLTLKWG